MSYTTVIEVWPGEKIEALAELSNSHGSAPIVWDALAQRYLGWRPHSWVTHNNDLDKLWGLWRDHTVPIAHRAVLMFTFDRCYVSDYARMARDIRAFLSDFVIPPDYANHWPTLAHAMETGLFTNRAINSPALGLYCTSVSDNPFQGPWNEEREEYDPLDWTTAYEVYTALDALQEETPR